MAKHEMEVQEVGITAREGGREHTCRAAQLEKASWKGTAPLRLSLSMHSLCQVVRRRRCSKEDG